MKQRLIGIFSGSFNPIHVGHLILANYMREFTDLDEVWFVVTPQNPLKEPGVLLDDHHRLEMVRLALEGVDGTRVSDIEFRLPRPSYTVDTLAALREENPDATFSLIIGGDNWEQFTQWKSYQTILENYRILVYPRRWRAVDIPPPNRDNVFVVNAPVIDISSTFIRDSIREGKNMQSFLPLKAYEYMEENGFYR